MGSRRGGRERARPARPGGLARRDARPRHPGHHDPARSRDPSPRAGGRCPARPCRRRPPGRDGSTGVPADGRRSPPSRHPPPSRWHREPATDPAGKTTTRRTPSSAPTAATTRAARRSGARWFAPCAAPSWADRVWECSHIGGDRFAGNLLLLPESLYFGRCDGTSAERVLAEYDAGRLDLTCFRGRSTFTIVEQAAEHFVRTERALDALDAIASVESLDDGQVSVRLADGAQGDDRQDAPGHGGEGTRSRRRRRSRARAPTG